MVPWHGSLMVKALTTHAGDRWFDPGVSSFAEKHDYFMILEVYCTWSPGENQKSENGMKL